MTMTEEDWGTSTDPDWWVAAPDAGVLSLVDVVMTPMAGTVQFMVNGRAMSGGKVKVHAGDTLAVTMARMLAPLVCSKCGDELIEHEHGLCGACEAAAVLDLLGLRRELRAS